MHSVLFFIKTYKRLYANLFVLPLPRSASRGQQQGTRLYSRGVDHFPRTPRCRGAGLARFRLRANRRIVRPSPRLPILRPIGRPASPATSTTRSRRRRRRRRRRRLRGHRTVAAVQRPRQRRTNRPRHQLHPVDGSKSRERRRSRRSGFQRHRRRRGNVVEHRTPEFAAPRTTTTPTAEPWRRSSTLRRPERGL